MEQIMFLPDIHLARYRFELDLLEPVHLPPFKGSALRGGFGHTLKRLTCYHSRGRCDECGMGNDCVYGYLFRTSPPDDSEVLSNLTEVARPFVIQPPLDPRETFEPGDSLEFHVVLIGRGIAYLPYFVLVFQQLGDAGLGRTRGNFVLQQVTALGLGDDRPIFDAADGTLYDCDLSAGPADLNALAATLPTDRLTIDFVTPTRLKHHGRWMHEGPPFHVLVRRLLDRVSSLSYFHCGQRWEIDFRGWIDRAEQVELVDAGTGWVDWSRYSGRQNQRVRMGGLVGPATYAGDLAPFRPLLALGELIHVGKGTVFGNGWFRVAAPAGSV